MITIISKELCANNKERVRVEMDDGEVLFFKLSKTLSSAQIKDSARNECTKIKEAMELQCRAERIDERIERKVLAGGIDVIAAREIDQEGE